MKILNSKYLLLLFPIIVFLYFYYYLNFDGLYGQDAYEYLRYSKVIKNYLVTFENPGDSYWPIFYPIIGALLSFIVQDISLALLLVSVISLSLSAIYLSKILDLLFSNSPHNTLFVFVFFLLSPIVFKSGLLIMSDQLTLSFIIITLYNYLKFKNTNNLKYFYYITIFTVSSFMVRYVSAVVLFPLVVSSSILFFSQKKIIKHLVFLILIIGLLFLPHILIKLNNPTAFLSHQWLQDWSFGNFFRQQFSTNDGAANNRFPNIIYAFSNIYHPRFLFIGFVFIPFLFLKKYRFIHFNIIITSILLYAFFLAGIPFQNPRFLILTLPFLLVVCYPIFVFLSKIKWINKLFYIGIVASIILQIFLISKLFKPTLERNKFEIEIAEILKPYQNNTLYSFDIDIALQGRNLKFKYYNLWRKRYTNIEDGALVLFHPTKFSEQWKGKNPMLNYNYFKEKNLLKTLKKLPNNWVLYRIEKN